MTEYSTHTEAMQAWFHAMGDHDRELMRKFKVPKSALVFIALADPAGVVSRPGKFMSSRKPAPPFGYTMALKHELCATGELGFSLFCYIWTSRLTQRGVELQRAREAGPQLCDYRARVKR
jgi:hypothetical protein